MNRIEIEVGEVIFVHVRVPLGWIVIDVHVLRRQLKLMVLHGVHILSVRTLMAELVEIIVEVHLMLRVGVEQLSGLLDLLLARPVMRHVIQPAPLHNRSARYHRIPFAVAASVAR